MDPVFIVGPPRSGTTLLRKMINLHSSINILPETHFFSEIYSERNRLNKIETKNYIDRIFSSKSEINLYKRYKIELLKVNHESLIEVYKKLLKLHKDQLGLEIVGEKFPANFLYYENIKKIFPNSKFILIRRNPKFALSSYIKRDDFPENYTRMIYYIKQSEEFIRKQKNDTLVVNYEDLIKSPIKILKKIFFFIDLNLEITEEELNSLPFSSSFNNFKGVKIDYNDKGIKKGNQRNWKDGLNESQISHIQKVNFNETYSENFFLNFELWIEHLRTIKRRVGLRKFY